MESSASMSTSNRGKTEIGEPEETIFPTSTIQEPNVREETVKASSPEKNVNKSENDAGNQSQNSETFSDNSKTSSGELLFMRNWQILARNLFSKVFFSLEDSDDDLILLSCIQHEIFNRQPEKTELFVKLVIDTGIINICVITLNLSLDKLVESQKFKTIYLLLTVIWNCCDKTPEMGRAVTAKKLHKSIIRNVEHPIFEVEKIGDVSKFPRILKIVEAMFSILYNTLRHNPESKQSFREDGVIEVCFKYLEASEPIIKTLALFTICFAADISTDNKQLITATSSSIQFILGSLLRPGMISPERRNDDGFSVQEVLEGLSLLSQNEENAKQMVNQGILELCEDIMRESRSDMEVKPCLDIIWSLTFHDEIRTRLKSCHGLLSIIEHYISNGNQEEKKISESAQGIKWNLEHLDQVGGPEKKTSREGHIMISYSWEQKELACQIKEKLNAAGKEVWIDAKNMQGDVFDVMTEAVENASHVICCISESYAVNENCTMEAKYALERKKKIVFAIVQPNYTASGWLELIMAGAFYCEMHSDEKIERNFMRLLAVLEGQPIEEEIVSRDSRETKQLETKRSKEKSLEKQEATFTDWSKDDVMEWFRSTGCSSNEKAMVVLRELDGNLLREFCTWYIKSPEYFLKIVKKEFGFHLVDLIKFSNAIACLMNR